ncbi:MAG TPA: hypothetical protein VEB40_15620 [Flavipsychrobacter sp.]|nr:hypothetical protein [Flavipsychrobacter sp.]
MRKATLLLTLAVLSLSLTSCYKNWTCACKITTTATYSSGPQTDIDYLHVELLGFKSKAKKDCNAMDDTENYGSVLSTTDCSLSE